MRLPLDAAARRLSCSVALAIASGWSMTSVSAAAPALADRYDASLSEVGIASGALWVTFALAQAPAGRLADRVPTATLTAWGAAGMAMANAAAALLPSLWPTVVLRLLAGIVGGSVMVVAARNVTTLGARGQGIVGGATAVGSTLAVASVPVLEPLIGWLTPYIGNVVLALIALVVVRRFRTSLVSSAPTAERATVASRAASRLRLRLVCLSSGIGCSLIAGFALGSWAPTFLNEQSGLGTAAAGLVGSAVVGASIVTRPLGGVFAHGGNFRVVSWSLWLVAAGALILATTPPAAVQVVALVVVGVCAGLPFAGVVDRAASLMPTAPGRAVGFTGTVGTLVGMASVVVFGVAVDHDAMDVVFVGLGVYAGAAAAATAWAARAGGAAEDGSPSPRSAREAPGPDGARRAGWTRLQKPR